MKNYNSFKEQRLIDDFLGKVSFTIPRVLSRRRIPKNIKKIVVIKLGSLGDSILCLPFISFLKEKTKAKIIIVHSKENGVVFEKQEFIDKKILVDITGKNPVNILKNSIGILFERPDIAIDLSYTGNSSAILSYYSSKYSIGFFNRTTRKRNRFFDSLIKVRPEEHLVKSYFKLSSVLKLGSFNEYLFLKGIKYSKEDKKFVNGLIRNGNDMVGIHCCHVISYKSWPAENFAKVVDYLASLGKKIYLVGSKKESHMVKEVLKRIKSKKNVFNIDGKTSIPQLAYLMEKFDFFVSNDGGLMHLAACMGTPTLGLFGVESPLRYSPFNKKSYSMYKGSLKNPLIKAYESKWPRNLKDNKDISKISPEEVIKVLEKKFL